MRDTRGSSDIGAMAHIIAVTFIGFHILALTTDHDAGSAGSEPAGPFGAFLLLTDAMFALVEAIAGVAVFAIAVAAAVWGGAFISAAVAVAAEDRLALEAPA